MKNFPFCTFVGKSVFLQATRRFIPGTKIHIHLPPAFAAR